MTTHQERQHDQGLLVRDFLVNPHARRIQDAFVELCIRLTEVSIRRRIAQGLRLPRKTDNVDADIRDSAVDVAGFMLGKHKGKPFGKLFNFYRNQGIIDSESSDPKVLLALLKMFVTVHRRQELFDLGEEENTQLALLKRGIKDILRVFEYREWKSPDDIATLVGLVDPPGGLRGEQEIIPYQTLLQIVGESYLSQGISRTKWCRAIFDRLNEMAEYRNCCRKHELIGAVIAVIMRYVNMEGVECASATETKIGLMMDLAQKAKKQALDWVRDNGLRNFVKSGKLDQQTAEKFLLAANCYLIDLINSGNADKLPVYFREVMPESEHDRYRADYKHMFDTVVNGAVKHFRNLM